MCKPMLDIFEMFFKDSPNKSSSLKNVKQINSFDASNYMEGISNEKHVVSCFSLTLDCSKVFVRHEIVTNTFYKLFHLGNQVMPKNKLFLKKTNNFQTFVGEIYKSSEPI